MMRWLLFVAGLALSRVCLSDGSLFLNPYPLFKTLDLSASSKRRGDRARATDVLSTLTALEEQINLLGEEGSDGRRDHYRDREKRDGDGDEMLPWQAKVLGKLLKVNSTLEDDSDYGVNTTGRPLFNRTIPAFVKKALLVFRKFYDRAMLYAKPHQKKIIFGGKLVSAVIIISVVLIQIGNWFKGMAEYELLLDKSDFELQSYGSNLNSVGNWLVSSMNHTAVAQYKYTSLVRRLEYILDRPCFPRMMNDYAIHVGRDVALLITGIDNRVRAKNRKLAGIQSQRSSQEQESAASSAQAQASGGALGDKDAESDAARGKGEALDGVCIDPAEESILDDLQRGVLLIQARQTDACLRMTRLQLLSACNTCEDLLNTWKGRMASKSQTFRLPLPRLILWKIPGIRPRLRASKMRGLKQVVDFFQVGGNGGHGGNGGSRASGDDSRNDQTLDRAQVGDASPEPIGGSRSASVDGAKAMRGRMSANDLPPASAPESFSIYASSALPGSSNSSNSAFISGGKRNEAPKNNVMSGNVDRMLKGLDTREKVILLEEIVGGLYNLVGRVQKHIDQFDDLRKELIRVRRQMSTKAAANGQNEVGLRTETMNTPAKNESIEDPNAVEIGQSDGYLDADADQQATWSALEGWAAAGSMLCSESLQRMSLHATRTTRDPVSAYSDQLTTAIVYDRKFSDSRNAGDIQMYRRRGPLGVILGNAHRFARGVRRLFPRQDRRSRRQRRRRAAREKKSKKRGGKAANSADANANDFSRIEIKRNATKYVPFPSGVTVIPAGNMTTNVLTSTSPKHYDEQRPTDRRGAGDAEGNLLSSSGTASRAKPPSIWDRWTENELFNAGVRTLAPLSSDTKHSTFGSPSRSNSKFSLSRRSANGNTATVDVPDSGNASATTVSVASNQVIVRSVEPSPGGRAAHWNTLIEFTLPGNLCDVIEKVLVRSDVFAASLSDIGDLVENRHTWGKFPSSILSTKGGSSSLSAMNHELYGTSEMNKANDVSSNTPQEGDKNAPQSLEVGEMSKLRSMLTAHPSSVWVKDIEYIHRTPRVLLNPQLTPLSLLLTLNTHNLTIDPDTNDVTGNAVLGVYSNLSMSNYCKGCSYEMRWEFDTVVMDNEYGRGHDHSTARQRSRSGPTDGEYDYSGAFQTRVTIRSRIHCPSSFYRSMVTARITSDIKALVTSWRRIASVIILEGGSWADKKRDLPKGDLQLLETLGRLYEDEIREIHSVGGTENLKNVSSKAGHEGDDDGADEYDDEDVEEVVEAAYDVETLNTADDANLDSSLANGSVNQTLGKMPTSSTQQSAEAPTSVQLYKGASGLPRLRTQWRTSGVVLRDLSTAAVAFDDHLHAIGLVRRSPRRGLLKLLRFKSILRVIFWSGVLLSASEITKRSEDIVKGWNFFKSNIKNFVKRRLATPTQGIINDVIFNRRVSLTDREALVDAKRSLSVMLNDFLKEYKTKYTDAERKEIVENLNMVPISLEYENELRRPLPNIVSGRIARLVLIQLQFVKKELLVAMQAIDELFNANQVNLQLLAVTPAILSVFVIQAMVKGVTGLVRSSSQGKFMESTAKVHMQLRVAMRDLERMLCMTGGARVGLQQGVAEGGVGDSGANLALVGYDMTPRDRGQLMSYLHRLQSLLVLHSNHFDSVTLRQLQEDLRDLSSSKLSSQQRLQLVERTVRRYSFFQPQRKIWEQI